MSSIADPNMTNAPARSAVEQFEIDYADAKRRNMRAWAIGTAIFLVVFVITAWLGDFFKMVQATMPDGSREWVWIISNGIPRLGDYIVQTFPVLRWDSLGADFGVWFWRWPVWLDLLIETILIAFVATVLGVVGGFIL